MYAHMMHIMYIKEITFVMYIIPNLSRKKMKTFQLRLLHRSLGV